MDKNVEELLSRSVKEIIPSKESLKEVLLSGKKLKIYIGTDATGESLHLGHATNYMILEKFRRLGHEVIFLIGDFTSRIGDPTDKGDVARKQLTREEVVRNTKTWINQIRPVIDIDNRGNPVRVMYNHEWLSKLTPEDLLNLASNFTVQQMIERDMFQKRMQENKPLYLHELFYPLMQGFDSVAMDVDAEMCGMDQKFNALAGRTLLRKLKNKEKFVIATKLLTDPEGKKMGKTEDNMVSLDQGPDDIFGKIMSWNDNLIMPGFELCTDINTEEVLRINNPKEQKILLAKEIVSMIHNKAKANKAQKNFENTFKKGAVPDNIIEISLSSGEELKNHIVNSKIVSSNTDWKRLIEENAVSIVGTEEIIKDPYIKADKDVVLRIGKKRFVKIIVK